MKNIKIIKKASKTSEISKLLKKIQENRVEVTLLTLRTGHVFSYLRQRLETKEILSKQKKKKKQNTSVKSLKNTTNEKQKKKNSSTVVLSIYFGINFYVYNGNQSFNEKKIHGQ